MTFLGIAGYFSAWIEDYMSLKGPLRAMIKDTEACPTKRKDAQSAAKFLCREVISRWGLPDQISSDNGREFVDKTVRLSLQKLGIKQCFGAMYHPQSQGMCERMNGVLKNRIVEICQHLGLNSR